MNTTSNIETNYGIFLPFEVFGTQSIGAKVAEMALFNFIWRFNVLVFWNETKSLEVGTFIKNYQNSVIAQNGQLGMEVPPHGLAQFVLFGSSLVFIKNMLETLDAKDFPNTGKFFIVCMSEIEKNCDEFELMELLWHLKVVDVVFVKNTSDKDDFKAYTYYPYNAKQCEDKTPVLLNITKHTKSKKYFKNMFPEKLRDLHGCPIILSTFHQPPYMVMEKKNQGFVLSGVDGELSKILASAMNFTYKFRASTTWGAFENGVWTGSFGDVMLGNANFSITSAALTHQRYLSFHVSFCYNFIEISWATSAVLIPDWVKLMNPFSVQIRIILCVTFVIIALISFILRTRKWMRFEKSVGIRSDGKSFIFQSWLIFMGQVTSIETKKYAITVIFVLWIWYTMIIRTLYQTVLIGSLKDSRYEIPPKNIHEVLHIGRPFGGLATLRNYFTEEKDIFTQFVIIEPDDFMPVIEKVSTANTDFVVGANKAFLINYLKRYNGTRKMQIFENIFSSPTAIFFKHFSPLERPISKTLTKIMEGGLVERFTKQYFTKVSVTKADRGPEPLRMEHLSGCWFFMLLLWVVGLIVFIFEIIYQKYQKRQLKMLT